MVGLSLATSPRIELHLSFGTSTGIGLSACPRSSHIAKHVV